MPGFGPLYVHAPAMDAVPRGLPLVIALTGFTDAGGAVSQVIDILRDEVSTTTLVTFSNDRMLDYRARRPMVSFEEDHLTDYRPPRLELSLAHDLMGQPFLTLVGYEPDFGWEAFVDAVVELAENYGVESVTWIHSIAMPVPHTRPIGATVSGNRRDLIEEHSIWRPHTQVPATVGHLLEMRFSERGASVVSFVMLVPHYLADTEFPAAAMSALESITRATGLALPSDDLRQENIEFLAKVRDQIAANDELARMLEGLEQRYDQYMASSGLRNPLLDETDLPSADELAAELERFLASQSFGDEDKRGGPLA